MVTAVGLPLLMVNGKFQSLHSMTSKELETFIPFLVKCSVNRAGALLKNGIPEWWSSIIQYKFPLKKPNGLSDLGYRKHLSSVVCRCYWYHNAQYLLPFCAEIAANPNTVFLKSNEDNTTSIFYAKNSTHIMKFNNENKNYDMKPKTEKSQRRTLLSALPKKNTVITDIYLCENCDAEFSSHSDMLKHEKECYEVVSSGDGGLEDSDDDDNDDDDDDDDDEDEDEDDEDEDEDEDITPDTSSEEIEILEHIKPSVNSLIGKKNFLSSLNLHPKDSLNSLAMARLKKIAMEPKRWVNAELCLQRNRHIEFSSMVGRKIIEHCAKRDLVSNLQKASLVNESYCSTSIRPSREQKEPVVYKVTWKKVKKRIWEHQYCFNKKQRKSRYKTLKTGLDENSRKLLKQCKGLKIVLNRLKLNS